MKRLAVLFMIFLVAGCGGDKEQSTPKTAPPGAPRASAPSQTAPAGALIMPLEIDNRWVYEMSIYDTTVNRLRQASVDTFHVDRDTVIGGVTWYHIDGMGPSGTLASLNDVGFWILGPTGQPYLLAKFPAEPGDEFAPVVGVGTIINKLLQTDAKVVVPAGTFSCYKYAQIFGAQKRTTHNYFAPGVGLVKMEIVDESGTHVVFQSKLVALDLK